MELDTAARIKTEARLNKLVGNYAEAKTLLKKLEHIHDEMIGISGHEKAENLNRLAFMAAVTGESAEAVRAADKCLAIYRCLADRQEETLATYTMMLAYVLAESGSYNEAVQYGKEALAIFGKLHGENDQFVKYRAIDIECMKRSEVRDYLNKP